MSDMPEPLERTRTESDGGSPATTEEEQRTMKEYLRGDWGSVAASDGMIYFLTPCCRASAKGSMGATVCRNCYQEIDSLYGMAMLVTERHATTDLAAYIAEFEGVRATHRHTLIAAGIVSREASRQRHPSRNGGRIPTA